MVRDPKVERDQVVPLLAEHLAGARFACFDRLFGGRPTGDCLTVLVAPATGGEPLVLDDVRQQVEAALGLEIVGQDTFDVEPGQLEDVQHLASIDGYSGSLLGGVGLAS
jgi:hypothetical protein